MLTRRTNQDFKNIALMIEASSRLSKLNMTLEESLRSGSLSSLLTEGVSEEEAQNLEEIRMIFFSPYAFQDYC